MELINFFSILYFASGILSMTLMISFLFEKMKKINLVSIWMLLLLSWWSFSYYFWLKYENISEISYWISVFNIGLILTPINFYFWIVTLLKKSRGIVVFGGYLVSIFFIVFYSGNLIQDNMAIFNPSTKEGLIFILYFIFIHVGFYVFGLTELINSIINDQEKETKFVDVNILLILSLITILGILNLPAFYGIGYFLYGGLISIILSVFLFAYVAVRDKLMNLKIFLAQGLVGLILSINIIEIVFSQSTIESIYRSIMFVFLAFFSNLLIKNYRQDIIQKEELVKLGKRLENSNKKLRELDDAKNEFISIAAHQLRTPPTVIKGYLALAKEDPSNSLDSETKDSLSRAFASNERLIELVEDILNISRIESGKMQYNFQPGQSFENIIEDLRGAFEIKARDRGLEFKIIAQKGIPKIKMDSKKIREVISNLIDNAIKYTTSGSVTVSFKKTDYDMVRIEVADTGMGISKSEIGNLFKKFSRGSNADQLASGGIGLGIYVGRKIVEAHGGKIWAESPGIEKGSVFIIELPKNKK